MILKVRRHISICVFAIACGSCCGTIESKDAPARARRNPAWSLTVHEQLLQRHNIPPNRDGVLTYLTNLNPTAEQKRHAEELVRRLGSTSFTERESATRKLAAMPNPPIDALQKATTSADPEVASRSKKLLNLQRAAQTPLLFAVMKTITHRKITGVVRPLIAAIPLCESQYLLVAASEALRNSARAEDAKHLRAALQHKSVQVQTAAISALANVEKDNARVDLRSMIGPPMRNDTVVLAATRELANLGDRAALAALVKLLASKDIAVRSTAAIVLRSSTGKNFGFASYAKPEARAGLAKQWKAWLVNQGATTKLHYPLKPSSADASYLNGNTLLACGYKNVVIEYSPDWKEVWKHTARGAFSAEKLANGNVLIACYGPNEVIEVTPENKVVWKMSVKSCMNARLLSNGNILIAGHTSKQVLEVSRDKKTVWSYTSNSNCYDAHRLPNGNTMISSEKGVVEITPNKKIIWEYQPPLSIYGFHPLPNGNIVVANYSRGDVTEITRAKKTVWTHKVSSPFDAFRLPNGNTLITTSSNHLEVTPTGKVLYTRKGNTHGRTRR